MSPDIGAGERLCRRLRSRRCLSPGSDRASATSQPKGPPAEWVMMIAGPILSSSMAPRSRQAWCARASLRLRRNRRAGRHRGPRDGDVRAALRCHKLVEIRRSHVARARPLIVQMLEGDRLRIARVGIRRRESSGNVFERERLLAGTAPCRSGMKWRAAMAGAVDDINFVAFFERERSPSRGAHRGCPSSQCLVRRRHAPARSDRDGLTLRGRSRYRRTSVCR